MGHFPSLRLKPFLSLAIGHAPCPGTTGRGKNTRPAVYGGGGQTNNRPLDDGTTGYFRADDKTVMTVARVLSILSA